MRILVTGAGGFVGRALTRHLINRGHAVSALARGSFDIRRPWAGQVMEPDNLEGVVHLAARSTVRESWAEVADYYLTNVGGTAHLLQYLRGVQVPVVFASTSAVYGPDRAVALDERLPTAATTPYAATKVAAEQMLDFAARAGDVGVTTLRLFNVAGALEGVTDPSTSRIISNCLRAAAGEIPHVTINGDGSARREFTHVADVAEAFRLAVESTKVGGARTFNIGTGVGVSMAEVIQTAKAVTGVDFKVVHNPPVAEQQVVVARVDRAAQILGWKPQRSTLEQVIGDAWRYRATSR